MIARSYQTATGWSKKSNNVETLLQLQSPGRGVTTSIVIVKVSKHIFSQIEQLVQQRLWRRKPRGGRDGRRPKTGQPRSKTGQPGRTEQKAGRPGRHQPSKTWKSEKTRQSQWSHRRRKVWQSDACRWKVWQSGRTSAWRGWQGSRGEQLVAGDL